MQTNEESSQTKRLPTWLVACFWSVVGVAAALLTIFVLTASLLWLLRWTNPAGPWSSSPGSGGTAEAASSSPASSPANQTSTAAHLTAEAVVRSSATPSPLETSPETARQSTPVSSAADQSEPSAKGTPEPNLTQPTNAETAGTSASALTEQAAAVASNTRASGGLSEQSISGTQPSPKPSLPQAGTETSGESQVIPAPPEQDGQTGQPGEQAPVSGSASISDTPASAQAGSTATPTLRPSATPSPTSTNSPTPTPTPVPEPQEYIVQRDDWLSRLADKFYGDLLAYPAIVAATNAKAAVDDSYTLITDPDVIEIGQKLWIPTPEEAAVLLAEEK